MPTINLLARNCTLFTATKALDGRGARWQKMALKVFKLPGGEGGLRTPYLMPSDAEVERFTAGLLALGLAEIDELALAAGIG